MKLAQALLLLLCLVPFSHARELGRLFFSPAERLQLDKQFAHDNHNKPQNAIVANGLIQRSDGYRIAWLNGKLLLNAPGHKNNSLPVSIPGKQRTVEIKIGQRLLLDKLDSSRNDTTDDDQQDH